MEKMAFLCLVIERAFKRNYMRKITTIALIFMLIGVFLGQSIAHASHLRVPVGIDKKKVEVLIEHLKDKETTSSELLGFELAKKITDLFDKCTKEIFQNILSGSDTANIAVAGIGSVARQEMIASSDADLVIIFGKKEKQPKDKFKNLMIEELGKSGYDEVEVPVYGTVQECRDFCRKSPLSGEEAKQMRFIIGDRELFDKLQDTQDFPFFLSIEDPRVVGSIFYDIWDYEREHRLFEKKNLINIKKSWGMMRDILTICVIGKTIYGADGSSSLTVLQAMKNNGQFNEEQFKKLTEALSFYLLARNELQKIIDKSNPEKDIILPKSMPGLNQLKALRPVLNGKNFQEVLATHANNVSEIYEIIKGNMTDTLKNEYGAEWVEMLKKACDEKSTKAEHEEILAKRKSLGEKGYPILFALAWHSKHKSVLKKLYKLYNARKVFYLNIIYGLAYNHYTPLYIIQKLKVLNGEEYLQVRHRAEDNIKRSPRHWTHLKQRILAKFHAVRNKL